MLKGIKTAVAVALSIGGLGTAVTLSAVAASPKEMQPAAAAAYSGGEVVYLRPNSNWLSAGARFAVYSFNNSTSTNQWVDMTLCNEQANVYKATIPAGSWEAIIFCRMDGSTTANNWDNKWNQTNNITTYGESKLHLINDGAWDKSSQWYTLKSCVVAGDFNGWNTTSNPLTFDPSSYQYEGTFTTLADNTGFKTIYDGGWKGCNKVDPNVDSNYINISAGGDNNITAVVTGTYEVYYKVYADQIWAQISSDTEADTYATMFLSSITCDSTGRTAPVLTTSWSDLKDAFDDLTIGAQGKIKDASASESGTNVQKCAARYDYIVGKYGDETYEDFMERSPSPIGSARISFINKDSNTPMTIVVVSAVAIISLTGAFFLLRKKRKEQ